MSVLFLVVERDQDLSRFLSAVFPAPGHAVRRVSGIQEAEKELSRQSFDAVFMEAVLLEETSKDSFRALNQSFPAVPLVVVSDKPDREFDADALGENVFAMVSKPLNADSIKCLARQILRIRELSETVARLERQTCGGDLKNPITGLYNDQYLKERLGAEFQRAVRYFFSLSVVMIRPQLLDGEKAFSAWDEAGIPLRRFSDFLLSFSRRNDIVTDCGKERFLVMLPDTGKKGALVYARRFLEAAGRHDFGLPSGMRLNMSLGVASFPEDGVKAEANLLDLAERALDRAEKAGNNTIYAFRVLAAGDLQDIVNKKKPA
ncbi:MAG TPA: diguanylate cyclase [Verrucomicrobiae bacterium]|nr:diguanylate cyclase [Verrucomicrobiae bacterium]